MAIAITLFVVYAGSRLFFGGHAGDQGPSGFLTAAAGRCGMICAALWLAWPSLRRPAAWLPPGIALGGILVLMVIAVQPRLALVAVPAVGGLLAITSMIRLFRSVDR